MAGNIKGITIEFQGETTKLDNALKNINRESKTIDQELRKVDRALKFNPTNVDLWRQKQTLLTQKVQQTQQKLKLLKDEQKRMDASGVDKNSREYRELQREIIETESKLKTFKGKLREIGNVKLKALSEQFKSVGAKITEVGQGLTYKVTMPLAAVGAVAVKKFAEVDKTMQLTNATMGNSKNEADLLNKAMKEAAANSTFGMNDAATASLNFARAGLDAEQAASALAPSMALAAGEGGNLDTVSGGLVATINSFHDSFDSAGHYADVFANACNNSALDVDSLSNAMSVAAPVFSAAGYSVNDAALYMGTMANAGIEAGVAANSLKTGLARLVEPSKSGAAWMEKLGISITNSDGTMKDSVQVQKELHDAFSGLSKSEKIAAASAIFGKNQMSPWLALIDTAPSDVEEFSGALEQNGTAMDMQASQMSGFGGSLERLKSSFDVASTSLGEALAPAIDKVAQYIQKLVDWFNNLTPQQQTMIATIGLVVAAIGPLLMIIGSLISAVGTILGLAGPIGAAVAFITGPIGLVIALIAGLIAAGILIIKNWDKIEATAQLLWKQVQEAFKAMQTAIIKAWTVIKAKVSAAVAAVRTKIVTTFTNVKNSIKNIWNTIKTTIYNAWTGIKTKVSNAVTGVKTKITTTFSNLKTSVKNTWDKIKEAILKPIQTAKDKVKGIVDKLKGFFPLKMGKIFSGLQLPTISVNGGKAPFGIGGKGSLPKFHIKWHAQGGIFDSPTIAGIGEAGPEAVVPLDKFWDKLDKIAEGSGINVVINVQPSPGMDERQLAQLVERQLINSVKNRRLAWT